MTPTLDHLFAAHCAPALAGVKPANVVSCRTADHPDLEGQLEHYRRAFACRGVSFRSLSACAGRTLILVYRPKLLAEQLGQPSVAQALASFGYEDAAPLEEQLDRLSGRIAAGGGFPHELGLFLGYPAEDVLGFVAHAGQGYKLSGPWKVYGDVEAAKRTFDRMARVSRTLTRYVEGGSSLFRLFSVA